jgi:hypothetical protein
MASDLCDTAGCEKPSMAASLWCVDHSVEVMAAFKAQWDRLHARDPLSVWGVPARFRLPSGKEVVAASVSQCRRFRAMGAVKVTDGE